MEKYQRAVEVLGGLNSAVFAAPDAQALSLALVSQLNALQLFSDIDCRLEDSNDDTLGTTDLPRSTHAQHASIQPVRVSPGTSISNDGVHVVSMALANGQALTFYMAVPQPLAEAALRLLGLWVQSARLAVAHWAATD
jgi:hypothetical protein